MSSKALVPSPDLTVDGRAGKGHEEELQAEYSHLCPQEAALPGGVGNLRGDGRAGAGRADAPGATHPVQQ